MPATAPIPEEVAQRFTEPGEYGRYVIASGSYMLEGSDELDISSCDAMEPVAGFDPNTCRVPSLWENAADILGPAVAQYSFDQYMGEAGYAHVAVDPSKEH